jgi:hypothetical protein
MVEELSPIGPAFARFVSPSGKYPAFLPDNRKPLTANRFCATRRPQQISAATGVNLSGRAATNGKRDLHGPTEASRRMALKLCRTSY